MGEELKTGPPCPSGCGGDIYLNTLSCKLLCTLCGYSSPLKPPHEPAQPHEKPICYVAGALNDMSCDYIKNVRRMIVWAEKISDLGYAVFVPGLDLLWGIVTGNLDYDRAFNNSQPFLAKADIVFVCPGWENSKGTKRELDTAASLGVPIYYGDDGYKHLRALHEFDQANDVMDEKPSDEESARDRRRPKDATITGDDVRELNDEALAELKRRIAEGPYRTTGDNTTSMSSESRNPYMSADEGTCDDHVESSILLKDRRCSNCKHYEILNEGFADDGTSDGYCNHIPSDLSQARLRERISTRSDFGVSCKMWGTNYCAK